LSGGFPCQPYSSAGKRLGKEDDRHLWPEMLRAIREIQPRWVVGENVLGLVNWNGGLVFEEVQADLEAQGYEVQPYVLPAASVNAPHRRDRVWFVAWNSESAREAEKREVQRGQNTFTHRVRGTIQRNAPDTDNGGGSKDTIPARGKESDELSGLSRNAPDSVSLGNTPPRTSEEIKGNGGGNNGLSKERCEQTQRPNGLSGLSRNAPDSDNELRQRRDGQGTPNRSTFTEKRTESLNVPRGWDSFPTKSPICGGDDGLPRELDSITFPKWRNESIKAYGNAIVPQVAHQIFKAIEAYEESLLH